jgi:hypothetical protein
LNQGNKRGTNGEQTGNKRGTNGEQTGNKRGTNGEQTGNKRGHPLTIGKNDSFYPRKKEHPNNKKNEKFGDKTIRSTCFSAV